VERIRRCRQYRIFRTEEIHESSYSKSTSLYREILDINKVISRHVVIKFQSTKNKGKSLRAVKEKRYNLHRNEIILVADFKIAIQSRR
jgi:hypothetical protein